MRFGCESSEISSAFNRLYEGDLVSILNIHPDWNPVGNPGDPHMVRLQESSQINGRCFAFDRGIGGNNDLLHPSCLNSLEQLLCANVRWADAVQRGQYPEQNMIEASISPRSLDGI